MPGDVTRVLLIEDDPIDAARAKRQLGRGGTERHCFMLRHAPALQAGIDPLGSYAFLRVADTGRGLAAARKERLFDPFYTTKLAGRGLGLAGVVGVLQRHRAVARVDPREPTGTIFTILFPGAGEPASG
jgi:signal transduction histidine kinase